LVAGALYVAVNKLEPNPRDAAGLKILIIGLAGAAILAHLMPYSGVIPCSLCRELSDPCRYWWRLPGKMVATILGVLMAPRQIESLLK
jgi:hypothetical protein